MCQPSLVHLGRIGVEVFFSLHKRAKLLSTFFAVCTVININVYHALPIICRYSNQLTGSLGHTRYILNNICFCPSRFGQPDHFIPAEMTNGHIRSPSSTKNVEMVDPRPLYIASKRFFDIKSAKGEVCYTV